MPPRSYASAIRDAQVEKTRQHLFDTARAMLVEGGLDGLTLPKLAKAAGVSIPTVYRHFPTVDDLVRAFLEWIRPRVGQDPQRLLSCGAEELPELPLKNYPRYEAEAQVLRPLMESKAFNRVRVASVRDRAKVAAAALRPRAPGWSDAELEAMSGAIYALNSPIAWRWFRDTWGIESDEAARAVSWAMRTMIEALARGPERPRPSKKGKKR
ncbi:MAG: helix-turn-helix domain-containing protein [Polyangiales bacterium]